MDWVVNRPNKVVRSKPSGKKKQTFHCIECDKLWESISYRSQLAYFTRSDLSFYGFEKKICKNCV